MKGNLEVLIEHFVDRPKVYFMMFQGSRDRYRNYLERNFDREDVGKLIRNPGGDTFDYFVRRDYKKHGRKNKW